jgi:hypothetical protein
MRGVAKDTGAPKVIAMHLNMVVIIRQYKAIMKDYT